MNDIDRDKALAIRASAGRLSAAIETEVRMLEASGVKVSALGGVSLRGISLDVMDALDAADKGEVEIYTGHDMDGCVVRLQVARVGGVYISAVSEPWERTPKPTPPADWRVRAGIKKPVTA